MEAYLAARHNLILEDRGKRADHRRVSSPAEDERKADEILRRLRAEEAHTVWGAHIAVNHTHGSQQLFPGMEFLTGEYGGHLTSHTAHYLP